MDKAHKQRQVPMLMMRSYLLAFELPDCPVICSDSILLNGKDAKTAVAVDILSAHNSGFPSAAMVSGDPSEL